MFRKKVKPEHCRNMPEQICSGLFQCVLVVLEQFFICNYLI